MSWDEPLYNKNFALFTLWQDVERCCSAAAFCFTIVLVVAHLVFPPDWHLLYGVIGGITIGCVCGYAFGLHKKDQYGALLDEQLKQMGAAAQEPARSDEVLDR
jgi:hypothetical protein